MRRLLVSALIGLSCHGKSEAPPPPAESAAPAPDRLAAEERLPDSEVAFGLPLPRGMRLSRHFGDGAYFAGPIGMTALLEHVRGHVQAQDVQLRGRRAVMPRAIIKGDAERRTFRIEISTTGRGSLLHIKDVTPPVLATRGLPEAEIWRRAGRKPDGTLLDSREMY